MRTFVLPEIIHSCVFGFASVLFVLLVIGSSDYCCKIHRSFGARGNRHAFHLSNSDWRLHFLGHIWANSFGDHCSAFEDFLITKHSWSRILNYPLAEQEDGEKNDDHSNGDNLTLENVGAEVLGKYVRPYMLQWRRGGRGAIISWLLASARGI